MIAKTAISWKGRGVPQHIITSRSTWKEEGAQCRLCCGEPEHWDSRLAFLLSKKPSLLPQCSGSPQHRRHWAPSSYRVCPWKLAHSSVNLNNENLPPWSRTNVCYYTGLPSKSSYPKNPISHYGPMSCCCAQLKKKISPAAHNPL